MLTYLFEKVHWELNADTHTHTQISVSGISFQTVWLTCTTLLATHDVLGSEATVIWESFVKISHALLCTVHESKFNVMYRSMEYLLPPVTVQDIVPPCCKKNEHSWQPSCMVNVPWLFPFFHSHGISTLNIVRLSHTLQHFSSSCLTRLFIYMVAANATISWTPPSSHT